jgi:uncharacterized Tic20 family protein
MYDQNDGGPRREPGPGAPTGGGPGPFAPPPGYGGPPPAGYGAPPPEYGGPPPGYGGPPPGYGWTAYGPGYPPPAPPSSGLATLAHAGGIFGGFVVPLVVYILSRDRHDRFAHHEATEALNFQLTILIPMVAGFFLIFGGMSGILSSVAGGTGMAAFFLVFLVVWLIFFVVGIAAFACSIIGMVRASRWQPYRYPVNIRFVKPKLL